MIKSRDYTQKQNKLTLINTFVNSVLVYDNGDIFITMNYRGTDGLFLNRRRFDYSQGRPTKLH